MCPKFLITVFLFHFSVYASQIPNNGFSFPFFRLCLLNFRRSSKVVGGRRRRSVCRSRLSISEINKYFYCAVKIWGFRIPSIDRPGAPRVGGGGLLKNVSNIFKEILIKYTGGSVFEFFSGKKSDFTGRYVFFELCSRRDIFCEKQTEQKIFV